MKKYEAMCGENVSETAKRMVKLAKKSNDRVKATFNGIGLVTGPNGKPSDITKFYHEEGERRSEAYRKSPRGIADAKRAEEESKIAAAALKEGILPFSLKDEAGWKLSVEKNQDGYGSGVTRFAARWANMMEAEMAKGKKLKDIADKMSHKADVEGITGFMYGCAVSILSQVWTHGEELRRWHNKETQIGTEGDKANETGGVLNPALLCVGA